jgi:hypothetical protein
MVFDEKALATLFDISDNATNQKPKLHNFA